MNILFLEQYPRFGGGSERMGLSLCTHLRHAGHATHLLYATDGDMVNSFAAVTLSVTRAPVTPMAVRHPVQAAKSLRLLRRVVRERKIDVLFSSQLGYASLLAVAGKLFGLRTVMHVGLALAFKSPLYRWSQRRIGAAVAPSEPMRLACIALGWPPDRLHVVANGVDLQQFRPPADPAALRVQLGLPGDIPVMVYMGRLVEEKGIFTLVKAAAGLRRRGIAFHLAVVGSAPGNERKALADLAAHLGLGADCFSLRGISTQPELFFAAADLAVVPSQWAEPFGLVAIEAMACGTVPIVSDAGILPEIIGREQTACLFSQGSVSELEDRLGFMLTHPAARSQVRQACLLRVRDRFDLARCGRAYEKIFMDAPNS